MSRQQTTQRREAVSTIHDVVGAMRAIAAGRIQGLERALAAAARYEDVVLRSLAALLDGSATPPLSPPTGRARLLLVLTSEQPLCGTFNQEILTFAEQRWHALEQVGPVEVVVVGQRGLRQLLARGRRPHAAEPAATSLHGLRELVKRLAARVDHRYASGEIAALHVLYNRYESITEQTPTEEVLLPLDPDRLPRAVARHGSPPHRYLPLPDLLAGLIGEYAFIRLYRSAADSFASEQARRLTAMDGATRNTELLLHSLIDLERRERQDDITRQVLELIAARFAVD